MESEGNTTGTAGNLSENAGNSESVPNEETGTMEGVSANVEITETVGSNVNTGTMGSNANTGTMGSNANTGTMGSNANTGTMGSNANTGTMGSNANSGMGEEPSAGLANEFAISEPKTEKKKQIRSTKQREADSGAATMLARLKGMYNDEFADIPEANRPRAKAWVARAAYFKPTEKEREDYIKTMMKADRNALNGDKSISMGAMDNNSANAPVNSGTKNSLRTIVSNLEDALDRAVENATVSVVGAATTSQTRKAAKKFIKALSHSTKRMKASLKKEMGNSGKRAPPVNYSSMMNNPVNPMNGNSASSNFGLSNSEAPTNNSANSVSAISNSEAPPNNSGGPADNFSNSNSTANNSTANNSSLNLNLSKMNLNSVSTRPSNNSSNVNSNNRSYNKLMKSVGKTQKRGRNNSGYNSTNNSGNVNNMASPNQKKSKFTEI